MKIMLSYTSDSCQRIRAGASRSLFDKRVAKHGRPGEPKEANARKTARDSREEPRASKVR